MTDVVLETLLAGDVLSAAPALLGCRIRTEFDGAVTEIVVNDVEAYAGASDPASHAYRGRTARNAAMYGPPGTLYVYRSYGVHWCMNIVVGDEGDPSAVLLRGGVPTIGVDVMEERRGRSDHLADGPGKLCEALGVDGTYDGSSILDGPVRLLPPAGEVTGEIRATTRVGITRATDRPWRFLLP
ncbi:MAG: DNA-3-methyladenine glycosylase [Actinomycetota bacterium]